MQILDKNIKELNCPLIEDIPICINYIKENVKRITETIKTFKLLSHGKLVIEKNVKPLSLINAIVNIYKRKISDRITFIIDIADNFSFDCDSTALSHIIINLISNSIEAIKEKGEVIITAHEELNSKCITIQDNGSGIPQDKIDLIFDLSFTTKGKGSGVGLYIVKELADMMNIKIDVESTTEGTLFKLSVSKANMSGINTMLHAS